MNPLRSMLSVFLTDVVWRPAFWGLLGAFVVFFYDLFLPSHGDAGLTTQALIHGWKGFGVPVIGMGPPTNGLISPLHTFGGVLWSYPVSAEMAITLLNALCWGGVCWLMARLFPVLFPNPQAIRFQFIFMVLMVMLEPLFLRQAAMGGSEPLIAFMTLMVLAGLALRWPLWLVGFLLGGFVLSWVDGWLFALIVLGVVARGSKKQALWMVPGLAVALAPWVWFNLTHFDTLLPAGVFADIYLYRNDTLKELWLRFIHTLSLLFGLTYSGGGLNLFTGVFGLLLAGLGMRHLRAQDRVWHIMALNLGAYIFYMVVVHTNMTLGPMAMPRLLAFMFMVAGVSTALAGLRRWGVHAHLVRGCVVVFVLLWSGGMVASAYHAGTWTRYYEGMRADIAAYLKENVPKRVDGEATVLTSQYGMIALKGGVHVVDWYGRAEPEVQEALRHQTGYHLVRIIKHMEPEWLVLRDRDVAYMTIAGFDVRGYYKFRQQFEMDLNAPAFLRDNPVYVLFERNSRPLD